MKKLTATRILPKKSVKAKASPRVRIVKKCGVLVGNGDGVKVAVRVNVAVGIRVGCRVAVSVSSGTGFPRDAELYGWVNTVAAQVKSRKTRNAKKNI